MYADRIIEFADGKIQQDTRPFNGNGSTTRFRLKRTKMSFFTALKLSFNNIRTKKGRTFLTMFASSIGIIGIAVVLALSNGFQRQIDQTQKETLSQFPVTISQVGQDGSGQQQNLKQEFSKSNSVTAATSAAEKAQHENKLTSNYLDYVDKISPSLTKNISKTYATGLNLIRSVNGKYQAVKFSNTKQSGQTDFATLMAQTTGVGGSVYPIDRNGGQSFLKSNYKLLSGAYPDKPTDVVMVVNRDNSININALRNLGISVKENKKFTFDQLIGTTMQLVSNDDFYQSLPTGNFLPGNDYQKMSQANKTKTLKVVGILRVKSKNSDGILASGIAYSDRLTKQVMEDNRDSAIVKAQKNSNRNVMTNQELSAEAKPQMLAMIGGNAVPTSIQIYPSSFKDKDQILSYLDKYNKGKSKVNKVVYTDLAGNVSNLTGGLMDAITYVLVAFAGISLITSMIMIAIITYTSVLERTKEIGVLKALGARKRDITRVFDAETTILGFGSGILGVLIAWLLTFPANIILEKITGLSGVAALNLMHGVILILISTALTVLGGHVPARMAAKKDAAIALRSE
ncbi:ABC transporter permease [Lactiplantibacillus plantarum]|uniref:FtsX-like permease family protein n=4 Tax=Bacillati TaxID=1783272 RepID=A0A6B1XDF2_BIFLN|nr:MULTISPECIES: ABC transporter permease [Lactobacillaceae]MCT3277877.1 ABC transporter permease [Lactiplantibacillus pentosus]MDN5575981.1 ABC transporter permease [Pediococcus sp.]MZU09408.1 FtsX-like permease family protein [Bifidobacterium longum]RRG00984.1 MAG: ABC transporter permease [Lactobacillus sp.]MBA3078643.1 ABC transporter permease [Lactiplantibacillus plantarum]